MDKTQKFDIEIDGVLKQAELIDILEYQDERYAVYFTENKEDTNDLYVSKVIKDENGNDELIDVENEEVKEYILRIIHETINR